MASTPGGATEGQTQGQQTLKDHQESKNDRSDQSGKLIVIQSSFSRFAERFEFSGPRPYKERSWVRWNEVSGGLFGNRIIRRASDIEPPIERQRVPIPKKQNCSP